MSDRQRVRVGRDVTYRPTDAEATTGNGNAGDEWTARITAVNNDGTAEQGGGKGQFSLLAGPDAI